MLIKHLREVQSIIGQHRLRAVPLHVLVDVLDQHFRATEHEAQVLVSSLRDAWQQLETLNALVLEAAERELPSPEVQRSVGEAIERIDSVIEAVLGLEP